MNICVLILYTTSWQPLADVVIPNIQRYCDKFEYKLEVAKFEDPYPSNFGFNKIMYISDLFNLCEADIVWSLDMDTLITNHGIRVENFTKGEDNFWVTKDVNGINCGSFIARKSEWWDYFSQWVLNYQEVANCEQDAIALFMAEHEDPGITVLPHPSINSYMYYLYPEFKNITKEEEGNWHPGNFILHLPGLGMDDRLKIFTEIKEQIVYE